MGAKILALFHFRNILFFFTKQKNILARCVFPFCLKTLPDSIDSYTSLGHICISLCVGYVLSTGQNMQFLSVAIVTDESERFKVVAFRFLSSSSTA